MKIAVIMRGVPGSGKSTAARGILNHCLDKKQTAVICSNDDYPGYYDNPENKYDWSPQKAKKARKFCEEKFLEALTNEVDVVIVDNCHLTRRTYKFFVEEATKRGYEISFNVKKPSLEHNYIETCAKRNVHGVSAGHIYNMIKSWEDED
jgi:tRNA uridine 5-carbamoylmethylation protein Kti12